MYLNVINIIGRLVADPELKKGSATDGANDRVWGRIAVNRPGSDDADFVPFVCWGAVARATAEHCKKGKLVVLTGSLRTRSTQREDGSWDNYFEVNCSSVGFGPDAKNTPKGATAPAASVSAPATAPAAMPAMNTAQIAAMQLLLQQLTAAAPVAPTASESPFPPIPL